MSNIELCVSTDEGAGADVQARLRETLEDLGFASVAEAERAAGVGENQLYAALSRHRPLPPLLSRIAAGWGVRAAVFFLTRAEAAPLIAAARYARKSQPSALK